MASRNLAPHIRRLLSVAPGSPEAKDVQLAIEHLMMTVLRAGGRPAGEALISSLAGEGYVLERLAALPCMWRIATTPPRVLELWFTGGEEPVIGSLSYRVGKPWGRRRQREAAKLQAAFYARYESLGGKDEGRMEPGDRTVLLVGEFEAEINNGGFDQYLGNKGVQRAHEALRCLTAIGAKRIAGWLSEALSSAGDRDALGSLDEKFHERPDDLASLVMRHLARQALRRPGAAKR